MTTAFDLLHRGVQRKLWDMRWTELRPIQDQAIRQLLVKGGDLVISSPTASGKTEAAFLPVVSSIADAPTGSVRAMYIGPLKALINDQFRRVEDLCARLEMPVCKWHGDVNDSAKQRLLGSPSGILLITPESIEAMLVRRPTVMPKLFGKLSFVVVDEMHAFMGTERGAQLVSQLHRLSLRAGCDPTRIGLSATLGDPDAALRWLRPSGPAATLIRDSATGSAIKIKVRGQWQPAAPPRDEEDEDADVPDPIMRELARSILLACRGRTNLVFANAKSKIELLADALASLVVEMGLPDEIVVHHGSLSRERRMHAEERLRSASACTAVCTNTLELGIDIGNIDEVVQVSAPWSVASLVQRVGRSGRREDAARVLRGFFVEQIVDADSTIWDRLHLGFIQGIAIIELMLEKFIEPATLDRAHLSTVIHQCLAILAEMGGTDAVTLFKRIQGSGAFADLSPADFAALLREVGRLDLIEQMSDGTLILGLVGQRIVEHYSFFAAFNASEELRVVHGTEEIGTVARPPAPGEHLVLAGRRWLAQSVDVERREVVVTPARGVRAPKYEPLAASVHPVVHERMRRLLLSNEQPKYLDPIATEMLDAARAEARREGGFQPCARAYEAGVRLFIFGGSRVQLTLALVLSRAGLDARDMGVGFEIDGSAERVATALRSFATKPAVADLAAHADRVLKMRVLGREKFERFVASEVWQRAFAREELDEKGAVSAALRVADALTSPTFPRALPSPAANPSLPAAVQVPIAVGAASAERHELSPLENIDALCDAIASLPTRGPLPLRLIVVPNEAHAHAVKRELARGGRAKVLVGTRFVSIARLAEEVLGASGTPFVPGEELARVARIRSVFQSSPVLRYFDVTQLNEVPGWDRAFARTIGELEAEGLTPDLLFQASDEPRIRDVADVWRTLDASAASSWTRARMVREAKALLEKDPAALTADGDVLVAVSGHEPRVELDFARVLPRVRIATWAARPRRTTHASRIQKFVGAAHGSAWASVPAEQNVAQAELAILKGFLFEDPAVRGASDRVRSEGRDGTVELEEHEGVDAEIDAALTWVQAHVLNRQTPLEDIAILLPRLDPLAGMLSDRLAELAIPTHVIGGLPAMSTSGCARMQRVLRALTSHLHRRELIELLPALRVDREGRRHLTQSEATEAIGALGILGGSRVRPEGAREWSPRLRERVAAIEATIQRSKAGTEREEQVRALERTRDLLRSLEGVIDALTAAVDPFLRGAALAEAWPSIETFLREHVNLPAEGRQILELFAARVRSAAALPSIASVTGVEAHRLLEQMLSSVRLEAGRFGEPAVTIATVADAAGLTFTAVRILGAVEGGLPSVPREDPVLPDRVRAALRDRGVRDRADRTLVQLHAFDRVIRNVREQVVLSAPKRDLDGTYRELSSVGVEVAMALARDGIVVPRANQLHKIAFAPANDLLDHARRSAPLRQGTWQLRAARVRELPRRWAEPSALDLERGLALLEPNRLPDSLDGVFPRSGWFPVVPGLSADRPLSASRWRTFLECPHRFLLEVLLKFQAPSEELDDSELDPLTYGTLFHTVAERFYLKHGDAFIRSGGDLSSFETLAALAQEIAEEAFDEVLETYALAGSAVRSAQRERLRRDLRALLEIDRRLSRERLVGVERAFGTDAALSVPIGGRAVFVRGYIDRIDVEAGTAVLRDLKTGKPKPRKEGEEPDASIDAQLAFYTLVARVMREAWGLPQRLGAAYVYPAGARHTQRTFEDEDHRHLEKTAEAWLSMTTELAVSRAFPRTPNSEDCTYCAFRPVCGPSAESRARRVLDRSEPALATFRKAKTETP